jgi:hypothetical protein
LALSVCLGFDLVFSFCFSLSCSCFFSPFVSPILGIKLPTRTSAGAGVGDELLLLVADVLAAGASMISIEVLLPLLRLELDTCAFEVGAGVAESLLSPVSISRMSGHGVDVCKPAARMQCSA